jgi:hydroxyacylglutathione hydrolase
MFFRQFLHGNPVGSSYVFGCAGKGVAVAVDPYDESEPYRAVAREYGTEIRYVIDTHLHADHISGGRKLAEACGAAYVLHAESVTAFPFTPVRDGDVLEAGNTVIRVIHTPGHTPEHISLLVSDRARGSEEPWLVLTGHTLMVGDVGRTELAAELEAGASQLFDSLHGKLLHLPDWVELYPGAFAGSVCGRYLSPRTASTIGFERRHNRALRFTDREQFVAFMAQNVPVTPPRAAETRAYNQGLVAQVPR